MTLPAGNVWDDITLEQTARKMPVDETLMQSIDEDLYYLKTSVSSAAGVLEFKLNGDLSQVRSKLPLRRIDCAVVSSAKTFTKYSVYLEKAGTGGTLEVDLRKYRQPLTAITAVAALYQDNISSIALVGSGIATQSISKATPQVNTQSISYFKAAINVSSIIYSNGYWRYNLASAPDADYAVGDSVTFASCSNAANNGTFVIQKINDDGGSNICVSNAAGVAQTTAAGTAQLLAFSYNLTNPASTEFVVGETAIFASHTTGANNGNFTLFKVNSGGNNLVVKNASGATQAGVAGTCDSAHWNYTYSTSVASDFAVGESANMSGHSSSANNGNLRIVAVNQGGNNLIVYNVSGVAQGGIAGTANTNRWVYALPSDPSAQFVVGQTFIAASTTSVANSGTFTVKQINRSATNNLVVYNTSGVAQAGAVGTVTHTRMKFSFASDQSATYSTASRIETTNMPNSGNQGIFDVVEVNHGGGSNYNVVVENASGVAQASPAGHIKIESRSLFSTRPTITSTNDLSLASNGVLGSEAAVVDGTIIGWEILQIPTGTPFNLSTQIN